jgi:hypothetical protein
MDSVPDKDIEAWESEGGAAIAPLNVRTISMSRRANQVERANRIQRQINHELDRTARSFRSVGRAVFTPYEESVQVGR